MGDYLLLMYHPLFNSTTALSLNILVLSPIACKKLLGLPEYGKDSLT